MKHENLLRSIPIMVVFFAFVCAKAEINPDVLEFAYGSRLLVWVGVSLLWTLIMFGLHRSTKDVGVSNADLK